MKKRIVSLLLALMMVLSLVPATVWAAENHDGQVRVVVENTTYAKADGAAWDGTLVDKWVDLAPGSSMMDCIVSALGTYSQTGAESGYISLINGLSAGDGGEASGWMGTLNDWFTNVGFKDIKAGDKLFAGDIIRVMYTTKGYGADIGRRLEHPERHQPGGPVLQRGCPDSRLRLRQDRLHPDPAPGRHRHPDDGHRLQQEQPGVSHRRRHRLPPGGDRARP